VRAIPVSGPTPPIPLHRSSSSHTFRLTHHATPSTRRPTRRSLKIYTAVATSEARSDEDRPVPAPAIFTPYLRQFSETKRGTSVYVVHGRDENQRKSLFAFLRSIGLKPIEWRKALELAGTGTPYTVHLDNSAERRQELVTKLKNCGCDVDESDPDWLHEGDFTYP